MVSHHVVFIVTHFLIVQRLFNVIYIFNPQFSISHMNMFYSSSLLLFIVLFTGLLLLTVRYDATTSSLCIGRIFLIILASLTLSNRMRMIANKSK